MLKRTREAGLSGNHIIISWVEVLVIMSAVAQFRSGLAEALASRGLTVATWGSGGRRSANLLVVPTNPKLSVLYATDLAITRRMSSGIRHIRISK